jgi:hypothetical protein
MDPILQEFKADLDRIKNLLDLINCLKAFLNISPSGEYQDDPFLNNANTVYSQTKKCHTDTVVLTGTILLYLGGRFEFFVRTLFEDLSDRIVARCQSFQNLPKNMQQNLVLFTAEVMAKPRKYGHAENGVKHFVNVLAENLNDQNTLAEVNSRCLSITTENMWPDTLSELFVRIGAKDLWRRIGEQAGIMAFFGTGEPQKAENKAKALLRDFMETRNKIAHPIGTLTWPNTKEVLSFVDFIDVLASALSDIATVYEKTLPENSPAP